VILQNPTDEQRATSVDKLWKGFTNHERLRTTGPSKNPAHKSWSSTNCKALFSLDYSYNLCFYLDRHRKGMPQTFREKFHQTPSPCIRHWESTVYKKLKMTTLNYTLYTWWHEQKFVFEILLSLANIFSTKEILPLFTHGYSECWLLAEGIRL